MYKIYNKWFYKMTRKMINFLYPSGTDKICPLWFSVFAYNEHLEAS